MNQPVITLFFRKYLKQIFFFQARADHMAAFNIAATRSGTDDSVETIAAPIATPIAQIAPLNVALRTADYPRASFSYQFNSPTYAYSTGNFYANAPYYFGPQFLRASPVNEIRPAAIDIRPAAIEIRPAPLELRMPAETPEVAQVSIQLIDKLFYN